MDKPYTCPSMTTSIPQQPRVLLQALKSQKKLYSPTPPLPQLRQASQLIQKSLKWKCSPRSSPEEAMTVRSLLLAPGKSSKLAKVPGDTISMLEENDPDLETDFDH